MSLKPDSFHRSTERITGRLARKAEVGGTSPSHKMLVYLEEDIFNLVVFQSFILFKYILTTLHIQVGKNSSTLRIHLRNFIVYGFKQKTLIATPSLGKFISVQYFSSPFGANYSF